MCKEDILKEQRFQAEKMQSLARLAARSAHDFNNIFQSILSYAQLARMGKDPEDPDYQSLVRIEEATSRGTDLSQRLLTVGQKIATKPTPLNLNDKILAMHDLHSGGAPESIAVEYVFQEDIRTINADEGQIEQVLLQLASNARDAMPEGGRILFKTENVHLEKDHPLAHLHAVEGDYVRLTVSDNGSGMSEEVLHHLFEPFFTGKKEKKGAGLGLAMVYAIVRNHDGFIECTSTIGDGATFHVYLPAMDREFTPG